MFKTFLRSLGIDIKNIFKEEQVKIGVWNYPQRVQKIKDTEVWLVESAKPYSVVKGHDPIDNFSIYIRAKYGEKWYMVNKHGCPVGEAYSPSATKSWKLVRRLG